MHYELYIDVFFLENLMMDSLLLLAVGRGLKCRRSYGRAFLGGALGSLLTCLAIALPLPAPVRLFLFYVVISSVMLLTGVKIRGTGQFVKAFLLLYILAVFLGGIMQLFRPYMRFVSLFYAAAGGSYLILTKLWKILSIIQKQRERIVKVTLYRSDGSSVGTTALWDTGNELNDFVTGDPVNIVDPGLAEKITDMPAQEKGFHLIPYRCVAGESLMEVFRIKRMCIHVGKKEDGEESWIEEPLLGIGRGSLSGKKEYEMILNPQVFL